MSRAINRLHAGLRPDDTMIERLPARMRSYSYEADIDNDHVVALVLWCAAAPVIMVVGFVVGGLIAAGVCLLGLVVVPAGLAVRWSDRRAERLVAALPDAVEAVGRSLRTGASLRLAMAEAVQEAPPVVAQELRRVLDAVELGTPLARALEAWARRQPRAEVRIVAATFALAAENESGTTQALEGVSQTLRNRMTLRSEVQGLTAQAATSMQALVLLPIGLLVVDVAGDGGALRYLTTAPMGQVCLMLGVGLNLAGWTWMRLLIQRQMPR